jgi:hypothetical protein
VSKHPSIICCTICGLHGPLGGHGRCRRCYVWWLNHGRQADRPARVDLLGMPQPCTHCGQLARQRTRDLCQRVVRRGLPPRDQPTVVPRPYSRPAKPGAPAKPAQAPPTAARSGRTCERCRCWLGPCPPDFQSLCTRCSARWWAAEQHAEKGA